MHMLVVCSENDMLQASMENKAVTAFLVLLQFQWPLYAAHLEHLRRHILEQRQLTFPAFFQSIFNVDILEETLALIIEDAVSMDLGTSRRGTRGGNEGLASFFEQHTAGIVDEQQAVARALTDFVSTME